jgi:hypothetical protein
MTTATYLGLNRPFGRMAGNNIDAAAASTAADEIELRINVVTSGGHTMTKMEVVQALTQLRAYVMGADFLKGEGGAGGNIPLPVGAPVAGG